MQSRFYRSWTVFHHTLISGGWVTTGTGMVFGSCPGTVTSLTVMMTTLPTIMQDPVWMVEGLPYCKGVSAWWLWHSFFTHNLCWATAKKGQGFVRLSIEVVPELCLFYQPRNNFFCDLNFFTSCNNFSEYIVPVQHVLLLVRKFSDMYICSLCNISLHFEFFMYFWTKTFIQNSQYFLVHSWNVLPAKM